MKKLITFIIAIIATVSVKAQKGGIEGRITDNNDLPIPGVNITLKGTSIGTITNANGYFILNGIAQGKQTFLFSFVGFKNREIEVAISSNEVHDFGTIKLYEGSEILQDVVVTGERTNKFSREETAYVAKLPLKDLENTQVYSTVTSDLLISQVVTNFEDALKNAAGVQKLWTSTGRGGDGAGYYSLRGFSVQPRLVNGLPGITNGSINAANIERIEVIKGPSATLFGNTVSSYGGLINVVTKKPYAGFGGEMSYTTGSFGLNTITGDFNTPLDSENNIYFRLNTSYSTKNSFQDAGFRKSFFVAPSLTYKVNNRLTFSLYSEISQAEQTNPVFLFLNRSAPTEASNLDELNYNNKLSFTSNDLTLKNPSSNYRVETDYKISEAWNSQTIISQSHTSTEGYYSYLFDHNILGGNTYTRFISHQNASTHTTDVQQNFIGDFSIGNFRNRMVAGLDFFNATMLSNNTGYVFYGNVTPQGGVNNDNPFTPAVETAPFPLSKMAVNQALSGSALTTSKTSTNVYSAYVSDVINFTPAFSAMASVRLDVFDNQGNVLTDADDYDQTTLSPKFGLMYQPILDKFSVFANYQNGFSNVAPALVGDPNAGPQTVKNFKPEQANQFEAGLKTNLFDYRFNATLSYYNILVSNRVITDPDSPFNKIQGGEVTSSGYEIEINANPIAGFNIRAGYSNNDSKTTKTDNPNILNIRPLEAGPRSLYNFWSTYEIQKGALNGVGFGAGFNGGSEQAAINYVNTGTFMLPEYLIANASIFYQAEKFRIGLKLNNALDKEYYKGWSTITPQEPRSLMANFIYKF